MENFLKCHKIEFIYPFFPAPQLSEVFDHDDVDQVDEERQLLLLVSDDLPSSNRQNEEDPLNIENNTETIKLLGSDMSNTEDEEDVHLNDNGQRVKPSRAQDEYEEYSGNDNEYEEYSGNDNVPTPAEAITRPSSSVVRSSLQTTTETPGIDSSWTQS